jgi:hypothetical protein
MTPTNYPQIIEEAIEKMDQLTWQKESIDMEIAKLQQFVVATMNLLPDEVKEQFLARLDKIIEQQSKNVASLTDATRTVLRSVYPNYKTVADIRTKLVETGFDFSSYVSNALASVSTTLRRLKDSGEAEADEIEGVTVYRAKPEIIEAQQLGRGASVPLSSLLGPQGRLPADHPMRKLIWKPKRKTLGQRIGEKKGFGDPPVDEET